MSSVFLSACRADAMRQAEAVLQHLSAQCIEKYSFSCSSSCLYVQCHVTVKTSGQSLPLKCCSSNTYKLQLYTYRNKSYSSRKGERKGGGKSQQQAYPSLTLFYRDNQFPGADSLECSSNYVSGSVEVTTSYYHPLQHGGSFLLAL